MSAPHDSHDLCSDHGGENPTIWHLPVPQSLKDEWAVGDECVLAP